MRRPGLVNLAFILGVIVAPLVAAIVWAPVVMAMGASGTFEENFFFAALQFYGATIGIAAVLLLLRYRWMDGYVACLLASALIYILWEGSLMGARAFSPDAILFLLLEALPFALTAFLIRLIAGPRT